MDVFVKIFHTLLYLFIIFFYPYTSLLGVTGKWYHMVTKEQVATLSEHMCESKFLILQNPVGLFLTVFQ